MINFKNLFGFKEKIEQTKTEQKRPILQSEESSKKHKPNPNIVSQYYDS